MKKNSEVKTMDKDFHADQYRPRREMAKRRMKARETARLTQYAIFDGQVQNQAFMIDREGNRTPRLPLYEIHANGKLVELTGSLQSAQGAYTNASSPKQMVEVGLGFMKRLLRATNYFGQELG